MNKLTGLLRKYSLAKLCRLVAKRFLNISLIYIYRVLNLFREIFCKRVVLVNSSIMPVSKNWGDDVSTVIVKCINPQLTVIPYRYTWNLFKRNDFLCIGSIVSWLTTKKSIIWGSGVVYPEQKISAIPAKVLAVRGPLTRKYLLNQGIDCPEIYGDPALLFPFYYQPVVEKKYKLGIIPHFRDKENGILKTFRNTKSVTTIDVQGVRNWRGFIDRICECEYICSSSLHGIIISDAYHIPNCWIEFESGEQKRFAFHDYLQSVHKGEIDDPIVLKKGMSKDDLLDCCKKWKAPEIDLRKLLDVCPFKT